MDFRKHLIPAFAAGLMFCHALNATGIDWQLLPEQCHDVELSEGNDASYPAIEVRTTGRDPYLVGQLTAAPDATSEVLAFEYFCPSGIKSPSMYFGPPFVGKNRLSLPPMGIAEGWQSYQADISKLISENDLSSATRLRLDVGDKSDVRLQIRSLILRPKTDAERLADAERERNRQRKLNEAEAYRRYLGTDFPAAIKAVAVTSDKIRLEGLTPTDVGSLRLVEFPPESTLTGKGVSVNSDAQVKSRAFEVELSRFDGGRDRLQSAWRIQDEAGAMISPRFYATKIELRDEDVSPVRPKPRNRKGLTSVGERGPMQELPELGISAATINLVLPRFITNSPGPKRVLIDAPGDPVYFDPAAFASYDRTIDFARTHGIVVTAIVLIPSPRDGGAQVSALVHPENDGGVYAMPDLTTARGATIYAYVLDAIAKRYRNHQQAPGAITNWIAHNEVDFHPVWTNMGEQPRPLVYDTYYRSMRMIHNAAKSHNPHARVFVSLTHHWIVEDDGSTQKSWRQLAPREMLETLQRYSKLEGEFDWGIAYHPYPQSLFAKVAWKDTQVTNDFDTPLITIQNLEVLGRFLSQSSMRASSGKVRPVLLSEQGFHTDSDDEESQARQAGSLWYAMQKVRRMPMVESFHYHRWIDHPDEGGLMLGLRTLPTAELKYGAKKKSWYLYQALGTDQEEAVTKDLPRP